MPSPYNLALVEHCSQCSQRQTNGGFCNMAAEPVEALDTMKFTGAYPKGALLFVEGEQPRGVFVLCRGRAKLTTTSTEGRTLIVKIASPGEILGGPFSHPSQDRGSAGVRLFLHGAGRRRGARDSRARQRACGSVTPDPSLQCFDDRPR